VKRTADTSQRKRRKNKRDKKFVVFRARRCRFCEAGVIDVDYKDSGFLRRFLSARGKILAARFTGNCAKHQRKLGNAVKRGRYMGLLPYMVR